MVNGYITLTKDYGESYYEDLITDPTTDPVTTIPWWGYGLILTVQVNTFMIENYQENPDVKRMDLPKGKESWNQGFDSRIVELMQINSAITITGSIDNPTDIHSWGTTTLNGNISDSATSIILTSATAFPSQGMIKIGDEFIFYTGKSTNTLTGCQRGFHDTTAAAHLDTVTVTNKTNGAEYYFAALDFIKKHGGVLDLTWRNRTISVYMNKFNITDTKREHDGASQDPTSYEVQINCFEASLQ